MGTGRKFNKQPVTRPKKTVRERERRIRNQRKRLVALGMPEEQVSKLDAKAVRTLLRRPTAIGAAD